MTQLQSTIRTVALFIALILRQFNLLKPYINADLRSLIEEKHSIERRYYRFPYTYCTQYKRLKNKVNKTNCKAEKVHYFNKFRGYAGAPKKTWSILNEVMSRNKNDCNTELRIYGEHFTGDHRCLAKTFQRIFLQHRNATFFDNCAQF